MRRTFEMTADEYCCRHEEMEGACTACGADAYNVEPDARRYPCESCGKRAVYGLQELMLMGRIEIA